MARKPGDGKKESMLYNYISMYSLYTELFIVCEGLEEVVYADLVRS